MFLIDDSVSVYVGETDRQRDTNFAVGFQLFRIPVISYLDDSAQGLFYAVIDNCVDADCDGVLGEHFLGRDVEGDCSQVDAHTFVHARHREKRSYQRQCYLKYAKDKRKTVFGRAAGKSQDSISQIDVIVLKLQVLLRIRCSRLCPGRCSGKFAGSYEIVQGRWFTRTAKLHDIYLVRKPLPSGDPF